MRVVILSTYPPRRCGIASFTADLRDALREADPAVDVDVVERAAVGERRPAYEQLHQRTGVLADRRRAASAA